MRAEADGKTLKRELTKTLRQGAEPLKGELQLAVRAIPAKHNIDREGVSLRQAVARKMAVQVRYGGRYAGVRVVQKGTPEVRGFKLAGRKLNQSKAWRHPIYGRRANPEDWVEQKSRRPGWFDTTARASHARMKQKAIFAVEGMAGQVAARIAQRSRGA